MKIPYKVLIFAVLLMFSLTSCKFLLGPQNNEEQQLVIESNRDSSTYRYQDKVQIVNEYHNECKYLQIRVSSDWTEENIDTILSGQFEKTGWYDDELFVLMDGIYYVFDINSYEVPTDATFSSEYKLKEYNEEEFRKIYPDYESFDWIW